ncbi:MAG TPA: hypothetical protein VNZ61_09110 [Roseomonas sp.]|nr:hypothetical protein [Roseomonas sp.]
MRVKTDRNDACGIAQLVRLGWLKAVHVKAPKAPETVVEALLRVCEALLEELHALDRKLLETARADPVVRTQ